VAGCRYKTAHRRCYALLVRPSKFVPCIGVLGMALMTGLLHTPCPNQRETGQGQLCGEDTMVPLAHVRYIKRLTLRWLPPAGKGVKVVQLHRVEERA
jgi:hypothetical protein